MERNRYQQRGWLPVAVVILSTELGRAVHAGGLVWAAVAADPANIYRGQACAFIRAH
jgi:hypothetical protein